MYDTTRNKSGITAASIVVDPAVSGSYCIVLDAVRGTLNREAGVKILMPDGTTGVYALSSLKTLKNGADFFADNWKAEYTTTDGEKVYVAGADSQSPVYAAGSDRVYITDPANTNSVLYECKISEDGQSVELTEADTTDAYASTGSTVAMALSNSVTYKNGNSYIVNNGSNPLMLTSASLIFAENNNYDYYCFKGFSAPDINGASGDTGIYSLNEDGSVRFAFVRYAGNLIGGNIGILTSEITVSGTSKDLTLSFMMFDLKTGTNKGYAVDGDLDSFDKFLTTGMSPMPGKGDIIEYSMTADGALKDIETPKIIADFTSSANGDQLLNNRTQGNDDGWYSLMIGNTSGPNTYVVSGIDGGFKAGVSVLGTTHANASPASLQNVIVFNNDTLFADLIKNGTNPATANPTTLNSIWANLNSSGAMSSFLENGPCGDIYAAADDKGFVVDVKLRLNNNGRHVAEAIIIRKEVRAV